MEVFEEKNKFCIPFLHEDNAALNNAIHPDNTVVASALNLIIQAIQDKTEKHQELSTSIMTLSYHFTSRDILVKWHGI